MNRINKDVYFMGIARVVSLRSTCVRRSVGCVLVDKFNHILATGHNGVPRNVPHCIDSPCSGADYISGQGLDKCMAVHAESNALMQCHNVMQIVRCYSTAKPCIHCIKMLMNTTVEQVIYDQDYPGEIDFLPSFTLRQYSYAMEDSNQLATTRAV